jgi:hypothetical protein
MGKKKKREKREEFGRKSERRVNGFNVPGGFTSTGGGNGFPPDDLSRHVAKNNLKRIK